MRPWIVLSVLVALSPSVRAAGFLDNLDGVPYRWNVSATSPIHYRVDLGKLGTIENGPAVTLVDSSLAIWADVDIASVSFANDGPILDASATPAPVDVKGPGFTGTTLNPCTDGNYDDFVTFDLLGAPRNKTDDTIVIFDEDGSLFECYLGSGSSLYTLGLASAGTLVDSSHEITTGIALINGRGIVPGDETQIEATLVHELGHMLNLAHTQLNHEEGLDLSPLNDLLIPTMFPVLPENFAQLLTPEPDDRFSLGYLYPSPAYEGRGSLSGAIKRRTGENVRGVYVSCRNSADPRADAVSWISDQTFEDDGAYLCGDLNNGEYTVDIEPVFLAINYFTPDPPFIVSEYYSGSSEGFDPESDSSSFDANGELNPAEVRTAVAVTEGGRTEGIDLVLNEDGRLISGETASGKSTAFFPPWEYFIQVPQGADRLELDLRASFENVDLDLLVKCAPEFSLPFDSTAPPLWYPDDPSLGQAQFAETSDDGIEFMTIEGEDLRSCSEYHILIPNYSIGRDTGFELTATVFGADPGLSVKKGPGTERSSGSGEFLVMSRSFTARDDTIRLRGLTVTDEGDGALAGVGRANLYLDADGDGNFSGADDRLLATATDIDAGTRRIAFSGFDESIEDGETLTVLVTYETTAATAGGGWAALLLVLGLFFLRRFPAVRGTLVALIVPLLLLGSCSSRLSGFHPDIARSEDLTLRGLTFGDRINVCLTVNSVADFFGCH